MTAPGNIYEAEPDLLLRHVVYTDLRQIEAAVVYLKKAGELPSEYRTEEHVNELRAMFNNILDLALQAGSFGD